DFHVTGVQTCALPIWSGIPPPPAARWADAVHPKPRLPPLPCRSLLRGRTKRPLAFSARGEQRRGTTLFAGASRLRPLRSRLSWGATSWRGNGRTLPSERTGPSRAVRFEAQG